MMSRQNSHAALQPWNTEGTAERGSPAVGRLQAPITVGYLCPCSDMYGTEVSLLATLRALDRKRFRPVLIVISDGLLVQEAKASGITVEVLPWLSTMFRKSPIHSISTTVRFARWLRSRRISILELALWWQSLDLGIPVLAAKLVGVPFLFTNRLVLPSWLSLYEKLWMSVADGIIAVTRASIEPALRPRRSDRLFRVQPERIFIIPSARQIGALQKVQPVSLASLGVSPGAPLVGMVAAIDPRKRQTLFLEAAAIVARRLPEARFVIVGSPYSNQPKGPEYRKSLDRLVKSLELDGRVIFTGFRHDAVGLMKLFRVLVLPSESEAEGSVLIEAMAVGVPIVASAVDGIPEIVEHGKTGLLINGSNPKEYANAIIRVLKDPAYARALVSAGRMCAAQYDSACILRKIADCYDSLLNGRASA